MDYLERARQLSEELTAHRRYLHQHAEAGMDLPVSAAYIYDRLAALGCSPARLGGSGVTAMIGRPGRTVLLRAEMDALPMAEQSGFPFCSQTDAAHTCGHDLHAAALLTAARMLKENESSLPGTVKLLFQPGEEVLRGAGEMIRLGALSDPPVDAAFSCHVTTRTDTGTVAFRDGAAMAACSNFAVRVTGQGAHGASPSMGVDPINIAVHIYLSLQELIAREVSLQNGAVLTVGSFHAGSVPNTIPGEAAFSGTLRCFDDELHRQLRQRIVCLAEKTAEAFRGRAEVEWLSSAPVEYNDPALCAFVRDYVSRAMGRPALADDVRSGADDFAYITGAVPSVLAWVGAHDPEDSAPVYPGHHPKVVFDENAMPVMAALYAGLADAFLRREDGPAEP